jgi:drug/metabolite transporter (DMT)-like permease
MEKVIKSFQTYKYVEIGLIFLGICLMFQEINTSFWSGMGVALLLEASIMLAFDFYAERRGLDYLEWLKGLVSI